MCTARLLTAIYLLTKFHSIPFVLSKIWPGQTSIMKKKWLRRDNTVNIQGRIMVLMHSTSSPCHLSINQVSFQSLSVFLSLPSTGIYIQKCTKTDLNGNSSFKVICRTRYRDGQTDKVTTICFPLRFIGKRI